MERNDGAEVIRIGAQPADDSVDLIGIARELEPQLRRSGRASTLTCQIAALLGMQAVATELEWFDMTPATLQRALVGWQIASGAETGRLGEPLANLQPSQLQTTADLFTWADHLAQFVAPR